MFVCHQRYLLSTRNAVKSRPWALLYIHMIYVYVSAGSLSAYYAVCILIELGHAVKLPYYDTLEGVLTSDVSLGLQCAC